MANKVKRIEGYPDYLISDCGVIYSFVRNKFLRPDIIKPGGYLRVGLTNQDGRKRFLVHVLVLENFLHKRPEGLVACHNNGDPADNRIENLRWDTVSSNVRDQVKHGVHNTAGKEKTHCPKGHPYSGENLILNPSCGKQCRKCANEWCRNRYWEKKREQGGVTR